MSPERLLQVLVAEDNAINAQLLQELLARRGHRVQLATSGLVALALVKSQRFDLLLLDLHMPELDGFQVVTALREHERSSGGHLPVIALTARSRTEDRMRCRDLGMDDFLVKPIRAKALWAAIQRVAGTLSAPVNGPPPLISASVLLAACGADAGILEGICRALRTRLPEELTLVEQAFEAADAPRLREAAHSLSGTLAAFSTLAGNLSSQIEDLAAANQMAEAGLLLERLRAIAPELMVAVSNVSIQSLQHEAAD